MKLFIYNREKCMLSVAQEGQRSIRMDRNGCIFLCGDVVQYFGLIVGCKYLLVVDEDVPCHWFLCIVDDEVGFPVRLKKRKRYNSKGMPEEYCYGAVFNCSYLCHKILDNVGVDKSATFKLATTPVEMDGLKLYKILTSNPITRPDRKYVRKKDRTQMEV